MSEQTPPDQGPDSEPTPESGAEPTPTTPEGAPADAAPTGEDAPHDPEPTTVDQTVVAPTEATETSETSETTETTDAAAPPPPPRTSSRGKILAIVAAVVVVVLVAGALVGYLALKSDAHKLVTPSSAGSMKRDTGKEKALSTQLDQAEQQFITQGQPKCAKKTNYVKSAVYDQASTKRGPEGALVFLGAKLTKEQVPTTWRANCFSKAAKANGLTVINIDPGDGDGKAACASVTAPQKVAICAWATHDTIGYLVPTVPGYDSKTLAKIMRSLRSDVEQSE
jgi:hypothetical protein